jgi:hypothetical protein
LLATTAIQATAIQATAIQATTIQQATSNCSLSGIPIVLRIREQPYPNPNTSMLCGVSLFFSLFEHQPQNK